jgi:hypothetical protein
MSGICNYCQKSFPLSGLMVNYDYKICYDDVAKGTWDPKTKSFTPISNSADGLINNSVIIENLKNQIASLTTQLNTLTNTLNSVKIILNQHATTFNKQGLVVLTTGAFSSI